MPTAALYRDRLTLASRKTSVNAGMICSAFLPPPTGFVIAMRAAMYGEPRDLRVEWIIVSRWGPGGAFLSLARTLIAADADGIAPLHLMPRQSALALLDAGEADPIAPTFELAGQRPRDIALVGRFLAADGRLRVTCCDQILRIDGNFCCATRRPRTHRRFAAVQANWVGEFVEFNSWVPSRD